MQTVKVVTVSLCALVSAVAALANEPKGRWKTVPSEDIAKITQAMPAKPPATPKQPRRLLVFWRCEGFPHAAIPWCNKMVEIMARKTGAFSATFSTNYADLSAESLKQYDGLLLNNTTGLKLDAAKKQALLDFVNNGKGLIGIHAASDNFADWPAGVALMGGAFDGHPWTAGGTWAVKVDAPANPVNQSFGGKGFNIKDEIYQVKGPYSRATHCVLLSLDLGDERTRSANPDKVHRTDKDFAIAWLKRTGQGRVFYCSFGHNPEVYFNPAVVAYDLAGIQYALGDLPADNAPSQR